jgi:hypothetical protein
MPLFRHVQTLLAMSAASGDNQSGSSHRVVPNEGDLTNDTSQLFRAFFDVQQIGGASSPTTDVSVESSHDGSAWFKLVGSTQVTTETTMHEWKELAAIGPFLRVTTSLGGGTKPTHKVTVKIASTAPFKLRAE